ncbi:hypothetical protein BJ742DRAFT_784220 [Cladochytrium replicatum]|nr:hypothetical protein BJ742DRAFT_784220 [Cladochytrium replicatum]
MPELQSLTWEGNSNQQLHTENARRTCSTLYHMSFLLLLTMCPSASSTVSEQLFGAVVRRQEPLDPPASQTTTNLSPSSTVFPQSNATASTTTNSTVSVAFPTANSTASASPSPDIGSDVLAILQQYWPWILGFGAGAIVIVVLVVVVFCNAPRRTKKQRPRSDSHGAIILPDETNSIRDFRGRKSGEESRSKVSSKWSGSAGLSIPADAALSLDDRETSIANRSRMQLGDDLHEDTRGRQQNYGRTNAARSDSTGRNKKALLDPETLEEVFSNSPPPSFERRAGVDEPRFVPGSMILTSGGTSQSFDNQQRLQKSMHKRSASEPYRPPGNQITPPRSALYADLVTGPNTKRFSQLSNFSSAYNSSEGFRPDLLAPVGPRSALNVPQLQQQKVSPLFSHQGSQQLSSYSSPLSDSHYDVIPKRMDVTSPQYPPQQPYQSSTYHPSSLAQQPQIYAAGFVQGHEWSRGGPPAKQTATNEGGSSYQEPLQNRRLSQQFASRQGENRQNRISGHFDGYEGLYHSEQEGNVIYYHSNDRPQRHRFSDEFGYGQPDPIQSGQNYNYQQAPQTSALYHDYPAQQMPMGAGQSPVGDANSSRLIAAPMPVKASVQVAPTNLMTMIASPPPTEVHYRWVSGQTENYDGASLASSVSEDQTVSDRRASSYMSAPRISRVVDENFFRESVFMSDTLGRNTVTIVSSGDEGDLGSPGRDSRRRSGGSMGLVESRPSSERGKRTSMVGSMAGSEGGKQASLAGASSLGGTSFLAPSRGGIPLDRPLSFVSSESPAATTSTIQSIVNPSPSSNIPVGVSAVPASPSVPGPLSQFNSSRHSTTDSLSSYFDYFETDDERSTTDLHGSRAGSGSSRGEPDYETEDESVFNAGDDFASSMNKDFGFLGGSSASSNGSSTSFFGRSAPGVVAPLPAKPWSATLGVQHAPSPLAAALNLTALSPSPHLPQYRDVSSGSHQVIAGPSRIDGSTSPARMSQAEARRIVDDAFSKNVNLRRGDTIMTNASSVDRSSPYDSDTNDGEILDSLGDRRTSDATTVMTSGSGKRTSVIKQQPRDQ